MTFKPLFGQITILSLILVNFRVSRFHVSHLTHETFKLCLQNTLNMSKTARVYFGVLQCLSFLPYFFLLFWYFFPSSQIGHEEYAKLKAKYEFLKDS